MVALVIGLCLAVLTFLVMAAVPIGAATNEKSRSQTAADAAALGAAEEIRLTWVDVSTAPRVLMYPVPPPTPPVMPFSGMSGAQSFAAANDARLDVGDYHVTPARGRVYAKVTNTYAYDAGRGYATSDSTVEMDIDFSGCLWTNPVPPPPPPPAGNGPPKFERTIRCGAWEASYWIANTPPAYPTIEYTFGDTREKLYDHLEPRIVE
jgi:hypothetical protein